jgi:acetyl-CoA acetyltransferase
MSTDRNLPPTDALPGRPVYLVDGLRTPQLKSRGVPGPFRAADLAVAAGRALLLRQPLAAADLDEVVFGCVAAGPDEANIGRVIALRLGCGYAVPAWTVQRNCASGMQAIDSAAKDIALRRADLVLAGGTEAMSHHPVLLNDRMLLASADAIQRYGLRPRARVVDVAWSGLDAAQMGLGPAYAIAQLLQRRGWDTDAIDWWEINEAFAGQVLACRQALSDADFCRDALGRDRAFAPIDPERLNPDGGGIALGHPVGASGARIAWHLTRVLEAHGGRRGIAGLCIGGGQGGAMLLERVEADTTHPEAAL